MISFNIWDTVVLILFFVAVLFVGFWAGRKNNDDTEEYLLSGRKIGLVLFIMTNVSTWYGGILGVGEFTYRYGLLSWVTQGLPYYFFAILFAFFFARKVRNASLYTIPEKLESVYGTKVAALSSVFVFLLVSPAPYVLMVGSLIALVTGLNIFISLVLAVLIALAYLFKGGFRSDVYTDALQFVVMFTGFGVAVVIAYYHLGGLDYLKANLPPAHLSPMGSVSPMYLLVWFLIALWTFADPGFHQRCYAAKDGNVAFKGILISILFWALFDFMTNSLGLYARAFLPDLKNPVLSYPLFADKLLGPGVKGFFYAALFATILSTLNSFLFLSASTFSRDFLHRIQRGKGNTRHNTIIGLIIAGAVSVALAYLLPSVVNLWYMIGTVCIPGIVLLVVSAYYPILKVPSAFALSEIILASISSLAWHLCRQAGIISGNLAQIEPMITGLCAALAIHLAGLAVIRKGKII
jgi:SSS family solute:Na+ symporter